MNEQQRLTRRGTSGGTVETVRYVAGFLFIPGIAGRHDFVVLVEKLRPSWQAGRLNAVGGKIEAGETALQAMRREFNEEADSDQEGWTHFATLHCAEADIVFFRAVLENGSRMPTTATDENIVYVPVNAVLSATGDVAVDASLNGIAPERRFKLISNIPWLLSMALPEHRHDWPYEILEKA